MILDCQLKKVLRFVSMKMLGMRPVTLQYRLARKDCGDYELSLTGFVY